jgi:hypothetical protein
MEPQLPKPQFSPEAAPSTQPSAHNGEAFVAPRSAEVSAPLEQGRETREVFSDTSQGDPGPAQAFTPPPMPVIEPTQSAAAAPVAQDDTNPAVASDEDLIEKEWVEKAKQVVAETRNDPHAQDAAVGRLQADYLKKRYGKIIATPKEG